MGKSVTRKGASGVGWHKEKPLWVDKEDPVVSSLLLERRLIGWGEAISLYRKIRNLVRKESDEYVNGRVYGREEEERG